MKFAIKPCDISRSPTGMLLHYLGKLKIQIFFRCGRKRKQIAFLIATDFVIHPQSLTFSVFKILTSDLFFLVLVFILTIFFFILMFCGT